MNRPLPAFLALLFSERFRESHSLAVRNRRICKLVPANENPPETISISGGTYGEIQVFRSDQAAARCGIFRIVGSAP